LAELSPLDRLRELERYLEEHGEDVEETSDGWSGYAPLPPDEPPAGDETRYCPFFAEREQTLMQGA
jgi:hypothetical protein